MITYGVILLVIGIVIWAVGHAARVPTIVVIAGQAIGAIGLVLLIVGLLVLLLHGANADPEVDIDGLALLVGL